MNFSTENLSRTLTQVESICNDLTDLSQVEKYRLTPNTTVYHSAMKTLHLHFTKLMINYLKVTTFSRANKAKITFPYYLVLTSDTHTSIIIVKSTPYTPPSKL